MSPKLCSVEIAANLLMVDLYVEVIVPHLVNVGRMSVKKTECLLCKGNRAESGLEESMRKLKYYEVRQEGKEDKSVMRHTEFCFCKD